FAYVASHDMQEPLRMVASFTQLLGEKYKGRLDERADRYIAHATDGAARMQTLVRDLLSYSRLGSAPRAFAQIDFNEVVRDAIAPLREAIEAAGGEVIVGTLPAVLGDRQQLARVVQNLIGNA